MDKEERGKLLVEQEDTQQAIADMEKRLKDYGSYLNSLGNSIRNNLSSLRFSNVPTEITGEQPKKDTLPNTHDWNKYPDRESVVRLTLELQKKRADLQRIQNALKGQAKPK